MSAIYIRSSCFSSGFLFGWGMHINYRSALKKERHISTFLAACWNIRRVLFDIGEYCAGSKMG